MAGNLSNGMSNVQYFFDIQLKLVVGIIFEGFYVKFHFSGSNDTFKSIL